MLIAALQPFMQAPGMQMGRVGARSLTHYNGHGSWAPSRFDPTIPAFCLPTCGTATDSTAPTCPTGTNPQTDASGNILNGYAPGVNPNNASDPNQWCIIQTCPTGWSPTSDVDPSDGLTCHPDCPTGYVWLEPPTLNIPTPNCYRDCSLLTGTTFGAYVAVGSVWVPKCCTPCPSDYLYTCQYGNTGCRCTQVNVPPPPPSQSVSCTNRLWPTRTRTFKSFANTASRPRCPSGWTPFVGADGAWHCYSCAAVAGSIPYQLPDASVACICPSACPRGSRYCGPLCWRWADSWGWNPWGPTTANSKSANKIRSDFCASVAFTFASCIPPCSALTG
ncbi:hypothetical protein COHA_010113 [Chlorella ohadii]|uniref:Uncharacterized protein n=1 Tax=Chlorella ohadii TaxID=2649997 RepID=A0AAD5GXI3_9CHLO|nr:hypothetical protein COHA_010113 [Chlorella ohadii]